MPVVHGSERACYLPAADRIVLPARCAFHSAGAYYATWAHEAVHSTGHASRLAVAIAFVMVRVAQDGHLFEQEEAQQTGEQGRKQAVDIGVRLEGFRQRVQQRGRQQDADRQADHALDHARQQAVRQESGSRNADDPTERGGQQNGRQRGVNFVLLV